MCKLASTRHRSNAQQNSRAVSTETCTQQRYQQTKQSETNILSVVFRSCWPSAAARHPGGPFSLLTSFPASCFNRPSLFRNLPAVKQALLFFPPCPFSLHSFVTSPCSPLVVAQNRSFSSSFSRSCCCSCCCTFVSAHH